MAIADNPPPPPDPVVIRITDALKQADPAAQQEAIASIRSMLQTQPQKAVEKLRGGWLKSMLEAQRFQEVIELSQPTILGSAGDTGQLEGILTCRAQALVALDKNAEALSVAKQLYNVASMKGTSNAILVVCQCLNAVHPDDRDVLKRFRQEQVEGAKPTASITRPSEKRKTMLTDIPIDAKPYEAALRLMTGEDYRTLNSRANLMLLSGRTDEAWELLERAYSLANDRDLGTASENLARCMKAHDGTIGRANTWIASIRPKPMAASLQDIQLDAHPTTRPQARTQP